MLKKIKRCLTALIAAAVMASCSGCTMGTSTAYAMSVDGYELPAGIYISYQYSALSEAKSLAQKENPDIDTNDQEALEASTIEGKKFLDWVSDKTYENCVNHIAVIKKFDELKLEISEDDVTSYKKYAESVFEDKDNMWISNGVSESSYTDVLINMSKRDAIFNAFYGEDGSENVQESSLKDYYVNNNARVKYVGLDLHDSDGNELDEAGKKEIMDMANNFLNEVKTSEKENDIMTAFDNIQTEYDDYVAQKAAEAAGEETETEETTEAETEEVTEAETEEVTEAVTIANEEAEAETESVAEEEVDESESSKQEEPTDHAGNESVEEIDLPATTTVPEDTETETTETTTTDPYANETIIAVVTTDENTKEEDVTYTPSKKFYEWVYNESTKYNAPEIIEDEDTIYVAVKLDINNRMTSEDLWNEEQINQTRYSMYNDELDDKIAEWAKNLNVEKNQDAIDRYKPFDFKTEK